MNFSLRFAEGYETIVGERGVKTLGRPAPETFDRPRHPRRPSDTDP